MDELETLTRQNPEVRLGDYLIPRHRQYPVKVAFLPPVEKYVPAEKKKRQNGLSPLHLIPQC